MSITTDSSANRLGSLLLTLLLELNSLPLGAEQSYTPRPPPPGSQYAVVQSTSTAAGSRRRPTRIRSEQYRKTRARQFQEAVQASSPNPRVQSPQPSALPANAPLMRKTPAPATPPQSKGERFFAGAAKVMTHSWGDNIFVWLPAVSTDPNTGTTFGIMPVLVLADPKSRHIRHLLAPSYTYNELFGQTVTGRYYFYPTDASQLYGAASYSQFTNRELKLRYENTDSLYGILYVRGEGYYSVDASPRFFGVGPESAKGGESGYTAKEGVSRGSVGLNFANSWRATIGARFRRFSTASNIIPHTADLEQKFPSVNGLGTHNTVAADAHLLWDTRDSPVTPVRGASGELFVEKTSVALGSYADYVRYGMEGKQFIKYSHSTQVSVIRGLYEWENGPVLPFYELPTLGGRDTLRGFGDGRFYDRGRVVFNIEHRFTIASVGLMGIQTDFQLAPFVDVGTVFPTLGQIRGKYFHPVAGGAFRAAVKPNVVGDVELGIGREGPAVFVDINYPY